MSNTSIRWGIIGCGDVTEVKSGPAFSKVPNSQLVAVMRRDAAKAQDYATRHNVGKWYSDADELMSDPQINAVYIATPPASHKEYALAAIRRGLDVYVEKPVAMNTAEAGEIAAALAGTEVKLCVAHYRRALPMFLHVKELLDTHAIGDIRTVQIKMWQARKPQLVAATERSWRTDPAVSGGGYFHDLAPHQLDLMVYFFGEPLLAKGFSLNQAGLSAADDNVNGMALFPNNITLNGSWCFSVNDKDQIDECTIIGSNGSIRFPFFGNTVSWQNEGGSQTVEFAHPQHVQQPLITNIVDYLLGNGDNPCSIEDAMVSMRMMDVFTGE